MKEMLWTIYDLYQAYIFLFAYFLSVVITLSKNDKLAKSSVREKTFFLFFCFLVGSGSAIVISRIPIQDFMEPLKLVLGICLISVLGWNIIHLGELLEKVAKKGFSSEKWKCVGYGLIIFLIWMVQLLNQLPKEIVEWVECWYATDYSMGIGSRFLIGSVLSLFYDGYLERDVAWAFCAISMILLIAVASYMLGKVFQKAKSKTAIAFLTACFIACPGSLAAYWTETNMGRLEIYTLLLSLIAACLFIKIKKRGLKYGILILTVCICNAIYQGYVFLYFPIVFVVILCEAFKTQFHKKDVIYGIAVLVSAGVSFLFFQFGTSVVFSTTEQMVAAIEAKSNVVVAVDAIDLEVFSSIGDAFARANIPYLTSGKFPREALLMTIVILTPLVILAIALYVKCFAESEKKYKRIIHTPYFYCLLSQLAVLPQFLLNIDWGRWMIAIIVVFFFSILYLAYHQFYEMQKALQSLEVFLKKHIILAIVVVLYLAALPKFSVYGMRNELVSMLKNLASIFGLL